MSQRKAQFWLDDSSGTLREYTSEVNQVSLERAADILEDTSLNVDNISRVMGIGRAQLPLNGYFPASNTGIVKAIESSLPTTSVSKTWQLKLGAKYYNGECYPDGLKIGAIDGKKLIPWSSNLMVDDAVNKTSVALS